MYEENKSPANRKQGKMKNEKIFNLNASITNIDKNVNDFTSCPRYYRGTEKEASFKVDENLSLGTIVESGSGYHANRKNNELSSKGNPVYTLTKISNFTLKPIKIIVRENEPYVTYELKKSFKTFTKEILSSKLTYNEFKSWIKSISDELYFTGTPVEFEHLISDFIQDDREKKQVEGVRVIGFHKGNFSTIDGVYSYDGEQFTLADTMEYTSEKILETKILNSRAITKEELTELAPHLMGFNTPDKCIMELGWAMCAFMNMRLYENGYNIPILDKIGESGSGKTTTTKGLSMPLFGATNKLSCSGVTKFVLTKTMSISNCIPVFLDEFKPKTFDQNRLNMFSNAIRNVYDKSNDAKGRSDQNINNYPLISPVMIVGEQYTKEQAVNERKITMHFSEYDKTTERSNSMKYIERNPRKIGHLGNSMLRYVMSFNNKNIDDFNIIEEFNTKSKVQIDRTREHIALIAYGYYHFYTMCRTYGIELQYNPKQAFEIIETKYIQENGTGRKSDLLGTIELIDEMALNGVIRNKYDYIYNEDDQTLFIACGKIFTKMDKYIRDYNKKEESPLQIKIFKKLIIKEDYCIGGKEEVARLYNDNEEGSSSQRGFHLNLKNLVKHNIELNRFDIIKEENSSNVSKFNV